MKPEPIRKWIWAPTHGSAAHIDAEAPILLVIALCIHVKRRFSFFIEANGRYVLSYTHRTNIVYSKAYARIAASASVLTVPVVRCSGWHTAIPPSG